MVVSVDSENNCRYLTETNDFPILAGLDSEQKKHTAMEFLTDIMDDSSWDNDCEYEQIFTDDVEILAEIRKEI